MKKTIQDIDAIAAAQKKELAQIEREVEELMISLPDTEDQATAAAEAGDLERYRSLQDKLRRDKEAVEYLRIRADKLRSTPAASIEDAKEAWAGYTASYNKDLGKMTDEYSKLKRRLCALYMQMIDRQSEMLDIRKRFNGYVGKPAADKIMFPASEIFCRTAANTPGGVHLLKMGMTNLRDPDALFALNTYCIDNNKQGDLYNDPVFKKVESTLVDGTFAGIISGQ